MLKTGELASRSGLTVRTLHHYDSIGLLTPSVRRPRRRRFRAAHEAEPALQEGRLMTEKLLNFLMQAL